MGGYDFLESIYVEYDWQLNTSDERFIAKPLVTYVMTNIDGSSFDSGTFYVTENSFMSFFTMTSLMTSCLNEINVRYAEIGDIAPSHQESIAWEMNNDDDYTISWNANDYAPDLELSITSNNTNELVSVNTDKRGGSIGSWNAKDCVYGKEMFIDSTHLVIGLDGYSETVSVRISRGVYDDTESIVFKIYDGFNEIDGYCVSIQDEDDINTFIITPRNDDQPS